MEARRGRKGGYRLARLAGTISVEEVLRAVGAELDLTKELPADPSGGAEQRVLRGMARRLQAALERELAILTLEELQFDLSSWQESISNAGGVMLG